MADGITGQSVAFTTLGCKVNRVESDTIAAHLLEAGVRLTETLEADVIVVNTCTVTGEADRKARKAVRRALSQPRNPTVVVTGCLAALDTGALAALGDRVVVVADKEEAFRKITELLGRRSGETAPGSAERAAAEDVLKTGGALRANEGFRTRVAVKIQDGCDAYCTYCIVPYARGGPSSVPLRDIVIQVGALAEAGTSEVVLTGINLGRYRDPATGAVLADVVSALDTTGISRIRLSSLEPADLTPHLLDALASSRALCAHLHVPLQAGSDRILSAMGRPYTASGYAVTIAAAREALPGLSVTTDVIAGFPGETHAEAERTREFVRDLGFARLHVFRYSRREGAPAAQMSGHLPAKTIAVRARELRSLDESLRQQHAASRIGTTVEVLVESVKDGIATGTTREYLTLAAPAAHYAPGSLGHACVVGRREATLIGEWA
ncbi:MAG: tRNA (N(6)-L-threonylcarbamoyladenosine(37)-C(2))-methylthiotransferase MtaB [Clostridiales bacterium]|nr:tRNA (N(6)-L-threonylcarbamoyladenosine(37)-C(2))-methylthiotransferase MtaB [Clostridiales bacterium]